MALGPNRGLEQSNRGVLLEFDDGLIEPSKEWSATSSTCQA